MDFIRFENLKKLISQENIPILHLVKKGLKFEKINHVLKESK